MPPGWDYNPSVWSQRLPIVLVALVGFGAAGWLALYQQGVTDTVWEPFFDDGTRRIVRESGFSQLFERFPIRDAGIGALGYLADVVTGLIGDTRRWRTMPWIVVVFGFFVVPLGAVSVMLIVLQPVLYDAFCTLCLVSAGASLVMIGPALDEVLASLQYLRRVRDRGVSGWRAFWGHRRDPRSGGGRPMTARLAAVAVGIWLLAAPAVIDHSPTGSDHVRTVGPVVASLAFVALWPIARSARWATLPLGIWLAATPLFVHYGNMLAALNAVVCGMCIAGLALLGGAVPQRFGGGWRSLRAGRRD